MCLDVLRSMQREPDCVPTLLDEIGQGRGYDGRLDAAIDRIASDLADPARHEGQARRLVERIALTLSASLLVRHASGVLADAFVASRLDADWSGAMGTLGGGIDCATLARMAVPAA
jgi:putative acyl-CoA dehydrogenase